MNSEKNKHILAEYEKFWKRSNSTRPILNLSYKKDGFTSYREPVSAEEKYLDVSYAYNAFKHAISNMGFLAEGFPMKITDYGPGCLAACIGGSFTLGSNTIWFDENPIITDWENPPEIKFDEKSELWQKILESQRLYASDPDIHFCITDIGGTLDVVAALRGTENLLYDLYDYPDEVKAFTKQVQKEWFKVFDQQLQILRDAKQPYNAWMNIPSSLPWYPLQCDFSYMIAPEHFEEFVLPHITEQVNYMDRSIYHLDGVGEIPHVDMLLEIPKLTGIQWVSGTGAESLLDEKWYGLYRKIQDKKKNLVLHLGSIENDMGHMERLIKTLDPRGVYMNISASSKDVASRILECITRWSE